MNGIVNIVIAGKSHELRFNVHGCMEFERMSFLNITENEAKCVTDLIYSGLFGAAIPKQTQIIAYEKVCDMMDEFYEEDNASGQLEAVWSAYHQSKFGKKFKEKIDALLKKKVEEESELLQLSE